jgi:hypothetical protein
LGPIQEPELRTIQEEDNTKDLPKKPTTKDWYNTQNRQTSTAKHSIKNRSKKSPSKTPASRTSSRSLHAASTKKPVFIAILVILL